MHYSIACIIVTYNRKTLLKRCLDAVYLQSYKPKTVYIIDNASTDGTIDSVKEWDYFECQRNEINYKYIRNYINEGGAGGFYLGLKTANEDTEYDGFWVMDDDGMPDVNCLNNLVKYLNSSDYIAPIVLSDEDKITTSFFRPLTTIDELIKQNPSGVIFNFASPFNGILYSKKCIEEVGYPKKEMFIWGDEINYQNRTQSKGMKPITILSAVHFHPLDKQIIVQYKGYNFIEISTKWKLYCYLRNSTFNEVYAPLKYPKSLLLYPIRIRRILGTLIVALKYYKYYSFNVNKQWGNTILRAYYDGLTKNFSRLGCYFH